jgi:hypothetical protein
MSPVEYMSFVIRLWRESSLQPGEIPSPWQIEAEHIQTSQVWKFETLSELFDFFRQQTKTKPEGENENACSKNT